MSSSHPSPQVQGAKEVERVQDPKGMDETKLTVFSRHNRTDADMNSQSLWQHSPGMHRFKQAGVPVLKADLGWGREYEFPSLIKRQMYTKENLIFSNGTTVVI